MGGITIKPKDPFEGRMDEYKVKCRVVKAYYRELIHRAEATGDKEEVDNLIKWRREELRVLDRQYRSDSELTGCKRALEKQKIYC